MREALYHPRFGYYTRHVRGVGRTGDFSTAATLHPALGWAVGAWANAHRAEVSRRGNWHLIELGGGGGQLAVGILCSVGWWARRGLCYHLVEISEGLRRTQRTALAGFAHKVQWHEDVQSALAVAEGRALIISNEFVDAFPCVQLVYDAESGDWREVRVRWPKDAEHPGEVFGEWHGAVPTFEATGGQRVEMLPSYQKWLSGCVGAWKGGRMLTVDYGDVPPALYHRRPRGTLRAYCRHQHIVGPEIYRRFGQQDLTADVNFADLRRWGDALGLGQGSLSTQAEFLNRWLPSRRRKLTNIDLALAFLLDPEGAGGAFKVLEQTR